MDTILFILHAASVAAMCYMFLVDDKRGPRQPFRSLFRYKADASAPGQAGKPGAARGQVPSYSRFAR